MHCNQVLGLCIEFGPVRDDSVPTPLPGSNPPCAGSRRHGLLPGLLVIACYLSFTPSSLKWFGRLQVWVVGGFSMFQMLNLYLEEIEATAVWFLA